MPNINITEVRLLAVPLENDYKHTLYFSSKQEQINFFKSKTIRVFSNFSYQRKDNIIRVPDLDDNGNITTYDGLVLSGVNYVMYKNSHYSNKWYFAFINELKYVDDGRTDIVIETDCIQTWLFDYTVKKSFVEREHVKNDTVGLHTVPETLETGEYICSDYSKDDYLNSLYVVVATSEKVSGWQGVGGTEEFEQSAGNLYNGIFAGMTYYTFQIPTDLVSLINFIKLFDDAGKGDGIQCIFIAPAFLIETENTIEIVGTKKPCKYDYAFSKPTKIDGYTPRNNKLLCYPYNYLLVSNMNGGEAVYHYEYFDNKNNQADFQIMGALTPGCSIRLAPKNYKGCAVNEIEGLNLGKFPICNWTSDVYTNWLTQQSVNIGVNTATGVAQVIFGTAGMMSGGGALAGAQMISNGALQIASVMGEKYAHSVMPAQSKGNLNCGDVITANSSNTFHFFRMSIKREFAKIIDGFFDMFGYKVNALKVPNKNHRANYWYTKTIDVNIDGNIPNKDLQIIKNCYDNGITFWKSADNIQNYSVDNDIIT